MPSKPNLHLRALAALLLTALLISFFHKQLIMLGIKNLDFPALVALSTIPFVLTYLLHYRARAIELSTELRAQKEKENALKAIIKKYNSNHFGQTENTNQKDKQSD